MANIKKIEAKDFPVLFGEKNRPSEEVTNKAELNLEGQAFENYAPKKGAIYRFTTFADAIVRKQPVEVGSKNYQFLILCEESLDGGNTFHKAVLSLNSFGKRDISNTPVHPSWYALGNIGARAEKLCEMGEIRVSDTGRTIQVPVFDKGQPVKVMATNADGSPVLGSDNKPVMVNKPKDQTVYDITPAS